MSAVREAVQREVEKLAGRAAREEEALVDDLGLRSLDLAQLVAVLELRLGVEPFVEHEAITDVRTVGDLARAFERVAATSGKQ